MATTDLKIARGFALPLDLVTEATAIVATRGAGKSSASAVIVEEGFDAGVQTVVFDRTGVYWGLRSNKAGTGPGLGIYVLGGPHGDVPLEPHAGVLIADLVVDSGHSFVLDLSDFSKAAAVKFAADFLERLYDRKARARTTLLLVMDEAHFYAPQTPRGGFKGDSAKLMGAMEDVVGLGRSRGIGVILTTQRTQALNKAVLDLIETLLVMRMLSPRAREAVKGWIQEKHEEDERGVLASLKELPTGTAWVWAPLRGMLERVAIRRIKTFDSYATPEPGKAAVEPTVRKELDLGALGEQMKATAERAKENDPAELRKQVRELQRQLAERAAEPERVEVPVEIEKVVEVPVFTDKDRGWLEHIAKALDGFPDMIAPIQEKLAALAAKADAAGVDPEAVRKLAELRRPAPVAFPAPPRRDPIVLPEARVDLPAATRLNGAVPAPQQKILDALGWYEALGVMQPSRVQVAMIAGYSHSSGGYNNLISKLNTEGLVRAERGTKAVELTPEGRALATDPGLPTTNREVQEAILRRLPGPQAKLLREIISVYPKPISREELAQRTEYTASSGGYNNLLSKLRTGALIEYAPERSVVALDVLFPLG